MSLIMESFQEPKRLAYGLEQGVAHCRVGFVQAVVDKVLGFGDAFDDGLLGSGHATDHCAFCLGHAVGHGLTGVRHLVVHQRGRLLGVRFHRAPGAGHYIHHDGFAVVGPVRHLVGEVIPNLSILHAGRLDHIDRVTEQHLLQVLFLFKLRHVFFVHKSGHGVRDDLVNVLREELQTRYER